MATSASSREPVSTRVAPKRGSSTVPAIRPTTTAPHITAVTIAADSGVWPAASTR